MEGDDYETGYRDGWDSDAPQPSINRSADYRKGFWQGRADRDEAYPHLLQHQEQRQEPQA